MPNPFNNPFFPTLKRVCQKTTSHCGPAVLEMLASYVGVYIDQEEFVDAVGIRKKLDEYGMIVSEMRTAISILAPQLQFWYKSNSTLNDLSEIVNRFNFPVAVEWQGVFFEDEDEDNGHYSAVTHIDTVNNMIMLSDPYKRFAGSDRRFHILEFEDRWWDENEVINPYTGNTQVIRDDHMLFIVTPKEAIFPEYLGMLKQ
jgi:ABC-type bacteriocin/lantibiotic exporter with double-glycine peptidase domain